MTAHISIFIGGVTTLALALPTLVLGEYWGPVYDFVTQSIQAARHQNQKFMPIVANKLNASMFLGAVALMIALISTSRTFGRREVP